METDNERLNAIMENHWDDIQRRNQEIASLKALLKERDTKWQEAEHRAAAYKERAEGAEKELKVTDALLEERNKLLGLFDCPAHGGGCVPHAMEEVKALRLRTERLEGALRKYGIHIKPCVSTCDCGLLEAFSQEAEGLKK